tara:strand:+ start:913 stop:1191 length:279 start_codon:yes stop_codon:yes gene_type:complete
MELSDIPIWQWVLALWLSTWALVVFRTWNRVSWLLKASYPQHPMLKRPTLHMFIYVLCINVVLLFMGVQVVLFDKDRDRWVRAYVNALGQRL